MLKGEESEGGDTMSYSHDDESTDPHSDPEPMNLIPDVIPHLCKFLGIQDIKRCRLVCKSWNYGATPVLKAKTTIHVRLYPENDKDTDPWHGIIERLKLCQAKIRLEILNPLEYTLPPVDPKIFPLIGNLKSIFIQLYKAEEWQKDLCEKIIQNSSTTLEKLKFEWRHDLDFPSLRGTIFPKLKKLILHDFWDRSTAEGLEIIGEVIAEAFPALQYLKINCNQLSGISGTKILPKFPLSLNSLVLTGNLNAKAMKCILKIPSPLKKFVFRPNSFDTYDQYVNKLPTIIYKFLRKHSPTLEKLIIDMSGSDENYEKLVWKFPWEFGKTAVFPALKSFGIYNPMTFENIEFESSLGSKEFGRIDYSIGFPVLESLDVCTNACDLSRVMEAFLPNGTPIAKSVKKVEIDVDVVWHAETKDEKLARTNLYSRLLDIFPNARDSVMKHFLRGIVFM